MCIHTPYSGDQFALMESVVTLTMVLRKFDFKLAIKPEDVGIYTGIMQNIFICRFYVLFIQGLCGRFMCL